ncbi:MAG: type II secretion system protein [Planctomycetes bacterium]|nr:type II secretion system protein [Planctomycetota bacterium]
MSRIRNVRGFTLLEVILALAVSALIMAVVGPALIGTVRAQRQARALLEPLAAEQVALAVLRDDLLSVPAPTGSVIQGFTVVSAPVDSFAADTLQFLNNGAPPLHPSLAVRAADLGQATITWSCQASADGHGMAWTRSRQANLLAVDTAPAVPAEVMLDHLALLTVESLVGTAWSPTFDSTQHADCLPLALRITYAYADADGKPGPLHEVIIDLPQVGLDPSKAATS